MKTIQPISGLWAGLKRTPWGLLTLEFGAVQLVTGPLLALSYRPGIPAGYESTRELMQAAAMGWLLLGLHRYAAYGMAITAAVHLFAIYFRRRFRGNLVRGWLFGNLIFLLVLGSVFTGLLLPLDVRSGCATRVALSLLASLPLLGQPLARFFFGYTGTGDFDPNLFHVVHICVFPLALILGLWVHKLSRGKVVPAGDLRKWAAVGIVLAAGLLLFAAIFPPELGEAFDPVREVKNQVYPAWLFMSLYLLVSYTSSPTVVVSIVGGLLLLWLFGPGLEGRIKSSWGQRALTILGLLLVLGLILATVLAYPLTAVK